MNDISLNASMRSNLLSLQQISKLQDRTQLRLSTGLKVNSATDNPSSYYTATALNNRADDLSALLDAMGQGVQTIKAANEALETGTQILKLASVLLDKIFVENEANAIVQNEAELLAAIETNAKTIVIDGEITLHQSIHLNDGQKLVGTSYYKNLSSQKSALNFEVEEDSGLVVGKNSLISNLDVSYKNHVKTGAHGAILLENADNSQVSNVNIYVENDNNSISSANGNFTSAILVLNTQNAKISNNITIKAVNKKANGIFSGKNSSVEINGCVNIDAVISGIQAGAVNYENGTISISKNSILNIRAEVYSVTGHSSLNSHIDIRGLVNANSSILGLRLYGNAVININTSTQLIFYNIAAYDNSQINIVSSETNKAAVLSNGGNTIFADDSQLNIKTTNNATTALALNVAGNIIFKDFSLLNITVQGNNTNNITIYPPSAEDKTSLILSDNSKINFSNSKGSGYWQTKKEQNFIPEKNTIIINELVSYPDNFIQASGNRPTEPSEIELTNDLFDFKTFDAQENTFINTVLTNDQYKEILKQFDDVINDASYKGINLLKDQSLKINFNENRSAFVEVKGYDLSSEKLGLSALNWKGVQNLYFNMQALERAENHLENISTKLGNYYSIITERQTFTENLINVLTEGADKLTLADMNEESANMLSLQTQQNLAVNSLSLASQASQAVLRLF